MPRKKRSPINAVIRRYLKRPTKPALTVRKLDRDTVLIAGNSVSLKFLAQLLLALADEKSCGVQLSPKAAGSAWFAKGMQLGLYLHRLPCREKNHPQGRSISKRSRRVNRSRGTKT